MNHSPDLLNAQIPLLRGAAHSIRPEWLGRYLGLRHLLNAGPSARKVFEAKYATFYGLNAAGLSAQFRQTYFDRLFDLRGADISTPPYAALLRELFEIPRLKGDKALACSFVSKLVATHDETRPLYDKYVSRFFGVSAPQSKSFELRIAGFINNLETVRTHYQLWIGHEPFLDVLDDLSRRVPSMKSVHPIRVCDFLVWQAGKNEGKAALQVASDLSAQRTEELS